MEREAPLVFALQASRGFGEAVAHALGTSLAPHEERGFADGEHRARPLESVRGRDAFVIQSLHADAAQGVGDKLLRLLFFIGALRDASARRVTALVPYLAYSRSDRKSRRGDPVATRYMACHLEAAGAHCVVTLDVHNLAAFQNAFRCRAENLEAAGLLAAHLVPAVGEEPVAVVSPDAGGIARAERFRERLAAILGRPVGSAFTEKRRGEEALGGGAFVGEVDGKVAILVDDIIATGATIARAARACREHGATRVLVAATHGLFAGEANEVLAACPVERIVVTDTVPGFRLANAALAARVASVSAAPLFSRAIAGLHEGGANGVLQDP